MEQAKFDKKPESMKELPSAPTAEEPMVVCTTLGPLLACFEEIGVDAAETLRRKGLLRSGILSWFEPATKKSWQRKRQVLSRTRQA